MNVLKFIERILFIIGILLAVAIGYRFFLPKIELQRELRAREAALRVDIQKANSAPAEMEATVRLRLLKIARKIWVCKPGKRFRFEG